MASLHLYSGYNAPIDEHGGEQMLTNDQIASHLEAIAEKLRGPENKITRHAQFLARVWMEDDDVLNCSFCGKNQRQIEKLIAGPGVYICNECATVCAEILLDHWGMELHLPFACSCEEADDHTSVVKKSSAPVCETAQAAEH